MGSRRRLAVILGCAGALWLGMGAGALWAQRRVGRGEAPPQPRLPELTVQGTVEDVRPGFLKVATNAGQTWVLRVLPNAKVQVTGKATREFLSAGQYIRFVAEVDTRRARVEQPVSKLTIFTPNLEVQPGAFPETGLGGGFGEKADGEKKAGERKKPAFGQSAGLGAGLGFGLGAGPAPAFAPGPGGGRKGGPGGGPAGKGAVPANQTFEVRGQISSIKAARVTLHVPNQHFKSALKIEIAEDADIDVELAGPNSIAVVQKGDKVQGKGSQLSENTGGLLEVEIALGEPLGSGQAKRKPPAKTERTTRSKRSGDAAEPAERPPAGEKGGRKPAHKAPPDQVPGEDAKGPA